MLFFVNFLYEHAYGRFTLELITSLLEVDLKELTEGTQEKS